MLPEGWLDKTLEDLITLQRGYDLPSQDRIDGSIPIMSAAGLTGYHHKSNAKGPGIVIGRSGSGFGNVHFSPKNYWAHNTALFVKDFKGNYEIYVYYFLKNIDFSSYNSGGVQPSLNRNFIYPIRIGIPPLPEQKKIAQILSTWDKAITTTEQLLANSQQQKKALMQQLLTGKNRLKGFWGEWRKVELGKLLDYQQPTEFLVESTEYSNEYNVPVLTAGKTFILGYTNENHGIYEKDLPIILFDDFTTDSKFVAFSFKVKSSAAKILTAKKDVNIKYVFEAMQKINFKVGGHQRHWISIYSNIVISLPSDEEQQAIAAVLSGADREIEILQKKLEGLKQEKKALMQQLLTGKRRVSIKEDLS